MRHRDYGRLKEIVPQGVFQIITEHTDITGIDGAYSKKATRGLVAAGVESKEAKHLIGEKAGELGTLQGADSDG